MLNRKAMVLYCGGASGMAPSSPASPGGGGVGGVAAGGGAAALLSRGLPEAGAGPFAAGVGAASEAGRALIGGGPRAHGPRAPIGLFEGAPRSLIGSGVGQPLPRPLSPPPARPEPLPLLPEEELDGCEPDAEGAEAGAGLAAPSPARQREEEEEEEGAAGAAAPAGEDDLRQVTLLLVGRYLREAAGAEEAPKGGGKLLQGLWGRLGAPHGHGCARRPAGKGAAAAEEKAGRALETLRRVGDGIVEKHRLAFQGMLKKMKIKKEEDLKTVSQVATHVFSDGITNWGRIVTLISFGAFVAKHLKSINQESSINTLAEIITDVLVTDKREWLVNHDAWEGFVKFFHVEDIEGSIRNVLMAFAGVAGLGASLAYMIR